MLKKWLIAAVIFVVLLMVGLSFLTAKYIDKEEILRVTQERQQLMKARDSILTLVAKNDSAKQVLEMKVVDLETEVDRARADVDSLENTRAEGQLNVRQLRSEDDLESQLMETYPEIKNSMRVTEVTHPEIPTLKFHYFSVPFRFAETFLIEHQNSQNYQKQRDRLNELDEMQQQVIDLQKKIVVLEEEKSAAFQSGYDSAYAKYLDVNEKYLTLLNKPPQVKFGLPQVGAIAIGTAAGFVGGVALGTSASK